MKRYKLYDTMEGVAVGYYDTLEEVKKATDEFFIDTDGDCDLIFLEHNGEKYKYADYIVISRKAYYTVYPE